MGAGAAALPAWADLVRGSPDVWEPGLDRVERRATAAHVDECLRLVWRRSLDGILCQGCIDLPGGSASVGVERGFLCFECGCALATVGAWRTHRARIHGARHPARALAFGSMCSGCCMEFHTRPRLPWHLMYSVSSCLGAYASFFAPCDDATVAAAAQRRIRIVLGLVPYLEQVNMTALPGCLPCASMAVDCHHRHMVLTVRRVFCPPVFQPSLMTVVSGVLRCRCIGTWMSRCTMCCTSFLVSGVLATSRIG